MIISCWRARPHRRRNHHIGQECKRQVTSHVYACYRQRPLVAAAIITASEKEDSRGGVKSETFGIGKRSGTTIRFEKHGTFFGETTVHVQKSTVNYSKLPMQQGNIINIIPNSYACKVILTQATIFSDNQPVRLCRYEHVLMQPWC